MYKQYLQRLDIEKMHGLVVVAVVQLRPDQCIFVPGECASVERSCHLVLFRIFISIGFAMWRHIVHQMKIGFVRFEL